jgi:mono/diheme cytochrome c family protein
MTGLLWQRLHGGSTHLPIVLLPLSLVFDLIALRQRDSATRRAFNSAALALAFTGLAGGCAAVIAGLAMTHGELLGTGKEKVHHLFVWPAMTLSVALGAARFFFRRNLTGARLWSYLAGTGIVSMLMLGVGYSGGELLLQSPTANVSSRQQPADMARGRDLFVMNCAHCHGQDARGTDEGPDLTKFHKSDARIFSAVKNGIKGEMPRFDQKLSDADVGDLVRFIRSLNSSV